MYILSHSIAFSKSCATNVYGLGSRPLSIQHKQDDQVVILVSILLVSDMTGASSPSYFWVGFFIQEILVLVGQNNAVGEQDEVLVLVHVLLLIY